jgi:hypothetical protein
MGTVRFGLAATAAGVVLLLLALLADPLGIEGSHAGGFGWKQTVAAIVGGVLIVVGLAVATLARRSGSYAQDRTRQP